MSIVSLVSGGLDSTVMAFLTIEEGIEQFPLFIDYGQLNKEKELDACIYNFRRYRLPTPKVVNISGFGDLLSSGLTDSDKHIFKDAFLPCRNLMFLTVGAAYAHQCKASSVAIGLLDETFSLFPDQTSAFIQEVQKTISISIGQTIRILTPLMTFSKADVVRIAKAKGINKTYSCHSGSNTPCGVCVACKEFDGLEV